MNRLSDNFKKTETATCIEDMVWEGDTIIDEGFFLELYGNPDGKYDEESSNGASYFTYIDKDIRYVELLNIFSYLGAIKDNTLTIRTVGDEDTQAREFCLENPFSNLLK